ncbi:MAG: C25 family cysteine peptidase [Candidatus Zhuqueibacterota bacterium]
MLWDYDAYNYLNRRPQEECADHFYACLTFSGSRPDDLPDVMIGRLSAGNATELANVVNKIINYETAYAGGDWRDDILLFEGQGLAGYSQFNSIDDYLQAESQITHFLYRYEPAHADADFMIRYNDVYPPPTTNIDDATQKLIAEFNAGRFIFNYECDHGSKFGFHPDGEGHCYTYFDVNDIPSLANGAKLAFWLNVCCKTGWFDNLDVDPCFGSNVDCLAEQLQYANNRGGIAVLASSRDDATGSYGVVDKYVYEAIFDKDGYNYNYNVDLIGEAILQAKFRWESWLRHKYNLFGDPSQNLFPQGLRSTISEATAYNNSRKLLRDANGRYHLVYESNGEIFYQYSVNGNGWIGGFRLSTGNGNNKYASVTGTSSKQFVVWQRYTGYSGGLHRYDTYFAKNTGTGWYTSTIANLSNLGFSTPTNSLPVITYKNVSGVNRLIVCAKTSSAIKYVTSDNDGSTWSSAANVPSTSSSHANPSLSMGPTTPASTIYVSYDNGSNVYYNNYTTAWGSAVNVSNGCGTSTNRYSSVEVDGSSGKNFVWQGYSNPVELWVIMHRRNSEAFQMFYPYGGEGSYRPSITGHASNKRSIVCYDDLNQIRRAYFNGSSWSETVAATNGVHPGLSAGTTAAKYVWTSGTVSPYEIKISTEQLSKSNFENIVYHRASVLQDTANSSLLWVELGEIKLVTGTIELELPQLSIQNQNLSLTPATAFQYLDSELFVIPDESTNLAWYQNIYGAGLQRLTAADSQNLVIKVQLLEVGSSNTITTLQEESLAATTEESRNKGYMTQDISDHRGKHVKLTVTVEGLASKLAGIVPGVTEIYLIKKEGVGKERPELLTNEQQPADFVLWQNYPNPFNAETTIRYQLPQASAVTLTIYNLLGQQIRRLVNERQLAGNYSIIWDSRDGQGTVLTSGIYVYRLEAGSFVSSKKLALIR